MRTAKDEAERNKIEFQLKAPPPWQKRLAASDRKANASSFAAAMTSLQSVQPTDAGISDNLRQHLDLPPGS